MLPEQAWQIIQEGGVAAIAIGVIAYLFLFVMKQQREERQEWRESHSSEREEWRKDIKTDRESANRVLGEFHETLKSAKNNSTRP